MTGVSASRNQSKLQLGTATLCMYALPLLAQLLLKERRVEEWRGEDKKKKKF